LNSAYACSSKFYTSVFAGVPIICNPLPAFRAFAGKYGGVTFFETLDPGAIRDSIERALDPRRYPCLRNEIKNAARELSSRSLEQRIDQAFCTLLDPV
jgi:hypothetical protein